MKIKRPLASRIPTMMMKSPAMNRFRFTKESITQESGKRPVSVRCTYGVTRTGEVLSVRGYTPLLHVLGENKDNNKTQILALASLMVFTLTLVFLISGGLLVHVSLKPGVMDILPEVRPVYPGVFIHNPQLEAAVRTLEHNKYNGSVVPGNDADPLAEVDWDIT